MMKRWSYSFVLAAICVWELAAQPAFATIVDVEVMKCPLCEKPYVIGAIVTWNYSLSDGREPPLSFGVCPHCLYAWQRDAAQTLSRSEKSRVREAIVEAHQHLPPATRRRLAKTLGDPATDDEAVLNAWLVNLCEAARAGSKKEIAAPRLSAEAHRPSYDGARERAVVKKALPNMVSAQRAGRPVALPKVSGDAQMHVLFQADDLIRQGNRPAAEYFLRWVSAADEKALAKCEYAVRQNLRALADAGFDWPPVSIDEARVPFIAVCLHYLRDRSAMPEAIRQQLTARGWSKLSDIAVEACAIRGDRAAAPLLAKRPDWQINDSLHAYYERVGTLADVPALEKYAARMSSNKAGTVLQYPEIERDEIESAIRVIRLKALVGGDSRVFLTSEKESNRPL